MVESPVSQSFAARVAAAVAISGPLCGGIDPSESLLDQWGLEPDAAGLRRFGLSLRGGVRRRGAGGQAPGGLLRTLGLDRVGGPRGGHGRGPGGRSAGHRRRQARRYRQHHGRPTQGPGWIPTARWRPMPSPPCPTSVWVRSSPCSTGPPATAGASSWSCAAPIPRAGPSKRPSPTVDGDRPWRTCSWLRSPRPTGPGWSHRERSGPSSAPPWNRRRSGWPNWAV